MSWLQVLQAAMAVVVVIVLFIVVTGRPSAVGRRLGVGRRSDGSWEEGRRVRDMTAPGRLAFIVGCAAWATYFVLVFVDADSTFSRLAFLLGTGATALVVVSEVRRLRRLGLDAIIGRARVSRPELRRAW